MIPGLGGMDYYRQLRSLGLWSLEECRNTADIIEVYMISKGILDTPMETFFNVDTNCRTRGHSLKLRRHHCRLDLRQHSSQRVVGVWNSLDQETVSSVLINVLKRNLARMCRHQMGLFMDALDARWVSMAKP
jgi:hypothetical protein